MNKNSVIVISAMFNDSMEDWILDDMIQNAMKPYFEWQTNHSECKVEFRQGFRDSLDYYGHVDIEAEFETDVDQALFITSFWGLPLKTLKLA